MWVWLAIAGLLLALEMMTGTLALLFAGVGALLAALLAYMLEGSLAGQIAAFSLGSMLGVGLAWKRYRLNKGRRGPLVLDEMAGQNAILVALPDVHGNVRVRFRGTEWPGRLEQGDALPAIGTTLVILSQEGSVLVLGPVVQHDAASVQ